MKGWEKRYNSQQKVFYPILFPLLKAFGRPPFLNARQVMQIEEAINPFIRDRQRKIIFYIRIHTMLINAMQVYKNRKKLKCMNILRVISDFTLKPAFSDERHYILKLHKINRELIDIVESKNTKDLETNHFRSKLQLAQNICILRLLKI
ncbi:MAG TPA: hypothetical protein VJB90_02240 [Candidatus Nanoarchaeia archaeon]|nr:hypothetical protein [Candidatus Nanoarchaeia archaeon]